MKAIQGKRGYPDLFIMEPRGIFHGLYIEIKKEDERIYKKDGVTPVSTHIDEQIDMLNELYLRQYYVSLAIGFDNVKETIDIYLNQK
jgi:hypothetical protein